MIKAKQGENNVYQLIFIMEMSYRDYQIQNYCGRAISLLYFFYVVNERVTGNWPITIEVSWQAVPFGNYKFIS